ncbi:MAG: stage III sporulation protein AC, partial [Clostridiales bacterium]|nr:stage III sporulation protein AC [Clostridiales bacterium]
MDVDLIFRIAAIGILVSVLNQVLTRSGRDEQATMVTLEGLVVVLMLVVQE